MKTKNDHKTIYMSNKLNLIHNHIKNILNMLISFKFNSTPYKIDNLNCFQIGILVFKRHPD